LSGCQGTRSRKILRSYV